MFNALRAVPPAVLIAFVVVGCRRVEVYREPTLRELASAAISHTVSINVEWTAPATPTSAEKKYKTTGSGVAITRTRVITCSHVIVDEAGAGHPDRIIVIKDATWVEKPGARQKGFIPVGNSTNVALDLAMLDVPDLDMDPIEVATDDEDVAAGDSVFFIGHPEKSANQMAPALGVAIVSSREIEGGRHVLRLDGSLNHGNSGGALISSESGKLVGIVRGTSTVFSDELKRFVVAATPPHHPIASANEDTLKLTKKALAEVSYNTQLGIGYASRLEDVRAFLASAGVSLGTSSPTPAP